MERETYYEVGNVQLMAQLYDERKQPEKEYRIDRELADVVYIFTSPDKPGIKFYDRTPYGAEAKMTGILPKGKFITDPNSISIEEWDETINKENRSVLVRGYNGGYKVTTIMVSEEQFDKIIKGIVSQIEKERVVIDTREKQLENKSDYKELLELKEKLIASTSNFADLNKKSSSGGFRK